MRMNIFFTILGNSLTLSMANNNPWATETTPQFGTNPAFVLEVGPCSDINPIKTVTYGSKLIEFHYCGEDWRSAETLCVRRGGKLWKPNSDTDYESVFQAIGHDPSGKLPIWFHSFPSWWIGSVERPFSGDVPETRYSGRKGTWIPKPKTCVSIIAHNITLAEQNCSFKQPFICEVQPYCSCKFGANEYMCNRHITVLDQCCLDVFCDPQGRIKLTSLHGLDEQGKASKLC